MPTTTGPFLIDSDTGDFTIWSLSPRFPKPFVLDGDLYAFWTLPTNEIGIFKSTDLGLTWNQVVAGGVVGTVVADSVLTDSEDANNSRLGWVINTGGANRDLHAGRFSGVTDAITDLATFPFLSSTSFPKLEYKPIAGEDWYYAEDTNGGLSLPIAVYTQSGGMFGAGVDITGVLPPAYGGAAIAIRSIFAASVSDSNDDTHLAWYYPDTSVSPTRYYFCYRKIGADLSTFGTAINLFNEQPALGVFRSVFGTPALLEADQLAIFPYAKSSLAIPTTYTARAVVVDYSVDPPTFTDIALGGNRLTQNVFQYANIHAVFDPTTSALRIFWIELRPSTNLDRLVQVEYDGVTVGSVEVVHDEWNDQSFPLIPQADQFLHMLSPPFDLGGGNSGFGFTCGLEYPDGGFVFCTSFYWTTTFGATACTAINATLIWSGPDTCIWDIEWDGDDCECSSPIPHFLRSTPEEYMIGNTLSQSGEDTGIYVSSVDPDFFTICKANLNAGVSPCTCRVELRRPHSTGR